MAIGAGGGIPGAGPCVGTYNEERRELVTLLFLTFPSLPPHSTRSPSKQSEAQNKHTKTPRWHRHMSRALLVRGLLLFILACHISIAQRTTARHPECTQKPKKENSGHTPYALGAVGRGVPLAARTLPRRAPHRGGGEGAHPPQGRFRRQAEAQAGTVAGWVSMVLIIVLVNVLSACMGEGCAAQEWVLSGCCGFVGNHPSKTKVSCVHPSPKPCPRIHGALEGIIRYRERTRPKGQDCSQQRSESCCEELKMRHTCMDWWIEDCWYRWNCSCGGTRNTSKSVAMTPRQGAQ